MVLVYTTTKYAMVTVIVKVKKTKRIAVSRLKLVLFYYITNIIYTQVQGFTAFRHPLEKSKLSFAVPLDNEGNFNRFATRQTYPVFLLTKEF